MSDIYPTQTAKRIETLFCVRHLAEFCHAIGVDHAKEAMAHLGVLQHAIYHLDWLFEQRWAVPVDLIASVWSDIYAALDFVTVLPERKQALTGDLRAYESVEAKLRAGFGNIPPLPQYYHLKTCDVRLGRTILAGEVRGSAASGVNLAAWNIADIVSEVCDDMVDLDEDLATFNGNRLLLGFVTAGPEYTLHAFSRFAKQLAASVDGQCGTGALGPSTALATQLARERLDELFVLLAEVSARVRDEPHFFIDSALNHAAPRSRALSHPSTAPSTRRIQPHHSFHTGVPA